MRALERLGLAACAKGDAVEPIMVEGYVCITPGGGAGSDLVLTYPQHDPSNIREYFGLAMEAERRGVAVAAGFAAQTPPALTTVAVPADGGAAYAAATSVACPVTGVDGQPRGRSFWNHRFVHQLRHAALRETRHGAVFQGTVRRLVYAKDVLADPALLAARSTIANPACAPHLPPRFAGFDANEHPVPYSGPRAADPGADADAGASAAGSVFKAPASELSAYRRLPPDTVVGVEWTDEAGNQRVTTARLSVVADGLYSTFRNHLHTETKPEIVSYVRAAPRPGGLGGVATAVGGRAPGSRSLLSRLPPPFPNPPAHCSSAGSCCTTHPGSASSCPTRSAATSSWRTPTPCCCTRCARDEMWAPSTHARARARSVSRVDGSPPPPPPNLCVFRSRPPRRACSSTCPRACSRRRTPRRAG